MKKTINSIILTLARHDGGRRYTFKYCPSLLPAGSCDLLLIAEGFVVI